MSSGEVFRVVYTGEPFEQHDAKHHFKSALFGHGELPTDESTNYNQEEKIKEIDSFYNKILEVQTNDR